MPVLCFFTHWTCGVVLSAVRVAMTVTRRWSIQTMAVWSSIARHKKQAYEQASPPREQSRELIPCDRLKESNSLLLQRLLMRERVFTSSGFFVPDHDIHAALCNIHGFDNASFSKVFFFYELWRDGLMAWSVKKDRFIERRKNISATWTHFFFFLPLKISKQNYVKRYLGTPWLLICYNPNSGLATKSRETWQQLRGSLENFVR